jgi:hypothetical protein
MGSSVPDDYDQYRQPLIRLSNSEAVATFPQKTKSLANYTGRAGCQRPPVRFVYEFWRNYVNLLP